MHKIWNFIALQTITNLWITLKTTKASFGKQIINYKYTFLKVAVKFKQVDAGGVQYVDSHRATLPAERPGVVCSVKNILVGISPIYLLRLAMLTGDMLTNLSAFRESAYRFSTLCYPPVDASKLTDIVNV